METLALYIHWPFCVFKCPYCDFNSHVRQSIDHNQWVESLKTALQTAAHHLPHRQLTSIFFGGGTPSLMVPKTVASLIQTAKSLWSISSNIEITLEANPGSVDTENLPAFFAAGVNRLSLGIQSLNPETLQFLGRKHTVDQAYKALEIAHQTFPRFTFDLMYALPQQRLDQWQQELTHGLSLVKGHLSVYQLTIEEGTSFYQAHRQGKFQMPDDEMAGQFYELTQDILRQANLPAYEVSNHASDETQQSRHNLSYWRYEDYLGIGPGSHSRITINGQRFALRDWKAPETWLKAVCETKSGCQEKIPLTPDEAAMEALMMGLRLTEGINFNQWQKKQLAPLEKVIDQSVIDTLIKEQYLWKNAHAFGATTQGQQRLNSILKKILK